jgi:hypothetical protein
MYERIESLGALDRSTRRSRRCIFVRLEDGAPLSTICSLGEFLEDLDNTARSAGLLGTAEIRELSPRIAAVVAVAMACASSDSEVPMGLCMSSGT